jgi:hypothetical protein
MDKSSGWGKRKGKDCERRKPRTRFPYPSGYAFYSSGRRFGDVPGSFSPQEELAQGSQTAVDSGGLAALDGAKVRLVAQDIGGRDGLGCEGLAAGQDKPAGKAGQIGLIAGDGCGGEVLPAQLVQEDLNNRDS